MSFESSPAMIPLIAFFVCCFVLGSSCPQPVTCPCGSSNQTFTFCPSNETIEIADTEMCKIFSLCEECLDDLQYCVKCPTGTSGPTCLQKDEFDENSEDIPGVQELASYYPRRHPVFTPEERKIRTKRQYILRQVVTGQNSSCRALEAPQYGAMNCRQTGGYSACTGRCLPGYTFEDQDGASEITLTCQRGSWTPMRYFPSCIAGSSCQLEVVGAGFFNCTIGMQGTRCDIMCDSVPQGRYRCYPGREWIPQLPYCVRPRETPTSRPSCACENGGVCLTSPFNVGNEVGCLCQPGFTGRFCEIEAAPIASCPDPGIPQGAERVSPDGSDAPLRRGFREGESVVYRCRNSLLEGDSLLTCRGDGRWSSVPPQCIPRATTPTISCPDPGLVENANRKNMDGSISNDLQTYSPGQFVVYDCRRGYALHGSSMLTCTESGRWSDRRPFCSRIRPMAVTTTEGPIFCQDPGVSEYGEILDAPAIDPLTPIGRYPTGSDIKYGCLPEYEMDGPDVIHCRDNGQWSSPHPECVQRPRNAGDSSENPLTCRIFPRIENGRIVQTSILDPRVRETENYEAGSEVRFTCNDGYNLVGSSTIYCKNTGEWSTAIPACVRNEPGSRNSCSDPGIPQGAERVNSDGTDAPLRRGFREGESVFYRCRNSVLKGDNLLTCRDGKWSSDAPQCIPRSSSIGGDAEVYCSDPGPISNGLYEVVGRPRRPVMREYPEGARLRYSCDPPYILHGSSEIICESTSVWSKDPPSCVQDCGRPLKRTKHRITFGKITSPGEWPWVVAIAKQQRNNISVICGGALLNRNTVLTAAHCLKDVPFILYFGKFHRRTEHDDISEVRVRSVRRILLHPNYNETTYASDIAIIKFNPSIRYTERIRPICLPTNRSSEINLRPNNLGYVTGWGVTENSTQSDVLLVAPLPVQSQAKCSRSYAAHNFPGIILPGMFCAGPDEGGRSACIGDSGSPLVFYNQDYNQYTIEGIVSFSIVGMCGQPGFYSVFTKVSRFINWILTYIR